MPLFTFHCQDCNLKKELLTNANTKHKCPKCNGDNFTKEVSKIKTRFAKYGQDFIEEDVAAFEKEQLTKMGTEIALYGSMKTAQDIYGEAAVKKTIAESDE